MTSIRQIEANRRNAILSTGPSSEAGKRRSRRNAVRHGLCAETVIDDLEDLEDYRAFEAAVIADYDARTVLERELVLRLASLLWRLRRATALETELLRIQAEILRERREQTRAQANRERAVSFHIVEAAIPPCDETANDWDADDAPRVDQQGAPVFPMDPSRDIAPRDLAHCFQRLANFNDGLFERLGRYETMLWRQMVQTHLLLESARRR
jgi:hypothetical protein